MQPTMADAITKMRPLIKKQPTEIQLELLWLLLETLAADTAQLQAYVDALHESFMRYAGTVQAYSESNALRAQKLKRDFEALAEKF
ncbi:MAG: hypothetical protein IKE46_01040 [Selenomonadaceae bacterium]|nr:hypothetical protein [Selenomonadaceae bacterium]